MKVNVEIPTDTVDPAYVVVLVFGDEGYGETHEDALDAFHQVLANAPNSCEWLEGEDAFLFQLVKTPSFQRVEVAGQ